MEESCGLEHRLSNVTVTSASLRELPRFSSAYLNTKRSPGDTHFALQQALAEDSSSLPSLVLVMESTKDVTTDGEIICICCNGDGKIFTGSECGLVSEWDLDLNLIDTLQLDDSVTCITNLPDDRILISCGCKILLLSADLKLLKTVVTHDEEVNCVRWLHVEDDPHNILLASCDDDGCIIISSLTSGKLSCSKAGHDNIATGVVWGDFDDDTSPHSGRLLYSSGLDCKVVQWLVSPESGELKVSHKLDCNSVPADAPTGSQYRVAPPMLHSLTAAGGILLATAENGCIYVIDPNAYDEESDNDATLLDHLLNVRRHTGSASCLAIADTLAGTLVISGGDDACIRMFSLKMASTVDDDVLEVGEEEVVKHEDKVNALCTIKQDGNWKVFVADINKRLSKYELKAGS